MGWSFREAADFGVACPRTLCSATSTEPLRSPDRVQGGHAEAVGRWGGRTVLGLGQAQAPTAIEGKLTNRAQEYK